MLAIRTGATVAAELIPTYINLINGALSGAVAGYLTNPFDVLKTRLMLFQQENDKGKFSSSAVKQIKGKQSKQVDERDGFQIMSQLKNIVQKDGVQCLFRGAHVRMLQLTIDSLMYFGTYESVKALLTRSI